MQTDVAIIGSGPSGLGTAFFLEREYEIFEKEEEYGGLLRSRNIDGFTFDYAGHIFFSPDPELMSLVLSFLQGNYHTVVRNAAIFSKGVFTRYPFQANTYGLPVEVVKECVLGLIEAVHTQHPGPPETFEQWIYQTFGDGIAKHFMIPYNSKLWAMDLSRMDCKWVVGRVPHPSIEEVLDGALHESPQNLGPNSVFHYPLQGGAACIPAAIAPSLRPIHLGKTATRIRVKEKVLELNGGKEEVTFKDLVVTMPLPELVRILDNVPSDIRAAAEGLEHLGVLCVNIGVRVPEATDRNWIYYPEPEFLCQRIFVQSNASRLTMPEGCSSFTHEISHSQYKKIDFDAAIEHSVEDLIRTRFIERKDQVAVTDMVNLPYGYVVQTNDREERVETVRAWLERKGIHLAGRFAEWAYYNTDHSLGAGKKLAAKLNRA